MKLLYALFVINVSFAVEPSLFQLQSTKQYVVQIQCATGSGTGTIVAANKILTAAHVVNAKDCIVIDYKNRDYSIVEYKIDEVKDLAIITLDRNTKSKGIRFADKPLQEYAKVWTIGFPLNVNYYLSEGRFQNKYTANFDILNMPIIFGNSGGGLFAIENGEIKIYAVISAVKQLQLNGLTVMPLTNMSISTSYNNTREMLWKK